MKHFYERMAAHWYEKREQYCKAGDEKHRAHADAELKNYLKMGGLPENWQPDNKERGDESSSDNAANH